MSYSKSDLLVYHQIFQPLQCSIRMNSISMTHFLHWMALFKWWCHQLASHADRQHGGCVDVTRMNWRAQSQCLRLFMHKIVFPCIVFSTNLHFFFQLCKETRNVNVTYHSRNKRGTAQLLFSFCRSTLGVLTVWPPLGERIYSDLYAKSCLYSFHPVQPSIPLHLARILEARGRECD